MVQESLKDNPYRLWVGDESSTTGLRCLFTPQCRFCNVGMEFWNAIPRNFAINDGTGKKNAHAVDILTWCPECGSIDLFGVAVSKEHYEFIQRRLRFLPKKYIPMPKKETFDLR